MFSIAKSSLNGINCARNAQQSEISAKEPKWLSFELVICRTFSDRYRTVLRNLLNSDKASINEKDEIYLDQISTKTDGFTVMHIPAHAKQMTCEEFFDNMFHTKLFESVTKTISDEQIAKLWEAYSHNTEKEESTTIICNDNIFWFVLDNIERILKNFCQFKGKCIKVVSF